MINKFKASIMNVAERLKYGITFVEIEMQFREDGLDFKGEKKLADGRNENVVYWHGWNQMAIDAMSSLLKDGVINARSYGASTAFCYFFDGSGLNLPIVKNIKYPYKTEHWLPVTFNKRN